MTSINGKKDIYENIENITGENNVCETMEPSSAGGLKETNEGNFQMDPISDLDLQILEMIEKSDDVWKCKVCGKTSINKKDMRRHAETHIEGISYPCHKCNKTFPNRNGLRNHIDYIHSELLSCDLCGKSGMNKMAFYRHNRTQHKTLSGTL